MKKVFSLSCFITLLLVLNSCNETLKTSNKNKFVYTSGSQIIEPNGKPIILKGTNIGNWLVPEGYMFKTGNANAPTRINQLIYQMVGPDSLKKFWDEYLDNYITREDIIYLKRIGANHIRLPFHYRLFTQDEYMGDRNQGFKYFDRIIKWSKEADIYVLFDMHCAPGGQTGDNIDDSEGYPYLFQSDISKDEMVRIWVEIAKRYKDEPIVLGYDLLNEPIAHYFKADYDVLKPELFSLYKRTVEEIRKVDPDHMIFLNGAEWSGDFSIFTDMSIPNIVYEFHKYWFPVEQSAVQFYVDFSKKHNVPIYIGETGENKDEWIMDFRTLLDKNEISWAFWPYKKMNNKSGIMNFTQPETYHLITAYADSSRNKYSDMRKNRPERKLVQKALNEFVENSKFKNNFPNEGYVNGLGFEVIQPEELTIEK